MTARVVLDWSSSDHVRHQPRPCICCGGWVYLVDDLGRPSHKTCAERAIATATEPIERKHPMSEPLVHVTVKRFEPNPSHAGMYMTFIDCPWCGREHMHGDGPGPRGSHCLGSGPPNPGYVLDYPSEGAPPASSSPTPGGTP